MNVRGEKWWQLRLSESAAVLFTFVLCLTIILCRNPLAVIRAEFWAEDATEFFFGALSLGVESLITPVWGFHCFLSRLIAYVASPFPVLWTPYIYAIACLIINAFVTSYFVRDG